MGRSIFRGLRVGLMSGVLGAAVLALGAAPAGAGPVPTSHGGFYMDSSPVHVGDTCTTYNSGHMVGTTSFIRIGDRMLIHVSFTHAIPNSTYTVELWGGPTSTNYCRHLDTLGTLHTNAQGGGSAGYTVALSSSDNYFFLAANNATSTRLATPFYTTVWSESALFHMP